MVGGRKDFLRLPYLNGGFVRSDGASEKFECLTYEHLTSYLDGTLERQALESCECHLAFCNRCSLALEMLKYLLNDELTPEETNLIEMVGSGRPMAAACALTPRGAPVDINEMNKGIDSEMDALERSWFTACRAAEAARAELETAGVSESAARALVEVVARLDNAERQKHEIMRRINALEDSLID